MNMYEIKGRCAAATEDLGNLIDSYEAGSPGIPAIEERVQLLSCLQDNIGRLLKEEEAEYVERQEIKDHCTAATSYETGPPSIPAIEERLQLLSSLQSNIGRLLKVEAAEYAERQGRVTPPDAD